MTEEYSEEYSEESDSDDLITKYYHSLPDKNNIHEYLHSFIDEEVITSSDKDDVEHFFIYCCGQYEISCDNIRYMVDMGIQFDINKAFVESCSYGIIDRFVYFLDMGADIDYNNGEALCHAINHLCENAIDVLLKRNIVLTNNILITAIERQHLSVIEHCMDSGLAVTDKHLDILLLHYESNKKMYACLTLFMERGDLTPNNMAKWLLKQIDNKTMINFTFISKIISLIGKQDSSIVDFFSQRYFIG